MCGSKPSESVSVYVIPFVSVCWPVCMHAKKIKKIKHTHIEVDGDSINDLQCKQQLQQNRHIVCVVSFSFATVETDYFDSGSWSKVDNSFLIPDNNLVASVSSPCQSLIASASRVCVCARARYIFMK